MRLLSCHSDGSYSLTLFHSTIPRYAILSHTWEQDEQEVTFEDITSGATSGRSTSRSIRFHLRSDKLGSAKIRFCAERIKEDGVEYFWIDSCCIDKSSSAELQEAIISMYRWYEQADRCYVYLSDVSNGKRSRSSEPLWMAELHRSRWFNRGWTLQELLAPKLVEFYSRDGTCLGNRTTLEPQIQRATNIPSEALRGRLLRDFSIEERLSWAEARETTKEEDLSYCLMGVFGISIPVMYGEGKQAARRRLQVAIASQIPIIEQMEEEKRRKIVMEEEQQFQKLMDSLRFDEMDDRQRSIQLAHPQTCEWLLEHPRFCEWRTWRNASVHRGFFWLKGKPGTGKSTLVKYAMLKMRNAFADGIHISFFFNRRGVDLERDVFGMYKSLLWQLLNKSKQPQDVFARLEPPLLPGASTQWTIGLLVQLFRFAIEQTRGKRVFVFIDALDECDTDEASSQIQEMIDFLQILGEEASSGAGTLNIFLSSRHYPTITIEHGFELRLEDEKQHVHDIEKYISGKLSILGQDTWAHKIRVEIQNKSEGVFLWIALVVPLLRKEFANGDRSALERKLNSVPTKLEELFKEMLLRDQSNVDRLRCCLQWILFANKPLEPEALRHAVLAGTYTATEWTLEPEEPLLESDRSDNKPYGLNPNLQFERSRMMRRVAGVGDEQADSTALSHAARLVSATYSPRTLAEQFVIASSKGLAEVITFDGGKQRVQLIHESVREYLLFKDGLCILETVTGTGHGLSHNRLKVWCERYLHRESVQQLLSARPGFIPRATPFLRYAVEELLFHANAAARNGVSQTQFLAAFSFSRWSRFAAFVLDPWQASNMATSMIRHLVEKGYVGLIRDMPDGTVNIDEKSCETFSCAPLRIAILNQDVPTIRALLDVPESQHFGNLSDFSLRCWITDHVDGKWFVEHECEAGDHTTTLAFLAPRVTSLLLFRLVQKGRIRADSVLRGSTMQCLILEGHESLVLKVLEISNGVNKITDGMGRSLLWWAAFSGSRPIVEFLLAADASDINAEPQYGQKLSANAVSRHQTRVTGSLSQSGEAVLNRTDIFGRGPLIEAASGNHIQVVQALLNTGRVDVNAESLSGETPLLTAVLQGNKEIVDLLLSDDKIDVNLGRHLQRTPLLEAVSRNRGDVVASLLAHERVQVDRADDAGHTPLGTAISEGREAIVRLLLDSGKIDVNLDISLRGRMTMSGRSHNIWPPLFLALRHRHEGIVQLLLNTGKVDLSVRGLHGLTALEMAEACGLKDSAVLLRQMAANSSNQAGHAGGS